MPQVKIPAVALLLIDEDNEKQKDQTGVYRTVW